MENLLVPTLPRGNALPATLLEKPPRSHAPAWERTTCDAPASRQRNSQTISTKIPPGHRELDAGASEAVGSHAGAWEPEKNPARPLRTRRRSVGSRGFPTRERGNQKNTAVFIQPRPAASA